MAHPLAAAPRRRLVQFRLWHVFVLTAFVAVAIVEIQAQRIRDPRLIGAAAAGFVAYALIAAAAWRFSHRVAERYGNAVRLFVYPVWMAVLYLVAVIAYLWIERWVTLGHV